MFDSTILLEQWWNGGFSGLWYSVFWKDETTLCCFLVFLIIMRVKANDNWMLSIVSDISLASGRSELLFWSLIGFFRPLPFPNVLCYKLHYIGVECRDDFKCLLGLEKTGSKLLQDLPMLLPRPTTQRILSSVGTEDLACISKFNYRLINYFIALLFLIKI